MATRPLPVVVNREGGAAAAAGSALADTVRSAFAAAGRAIDLQLVAAGGIADAVRGAQGRMVAVGGGDGTLRAAAAVLAAQRRALAVLPLGTRNHFARQIGADTLEVAARIAAAGRCRAIDLGQAGSAVFLNNASIGLYPELVRQRDRAAGPKWLRTACAGWAVVRSHRARRLRVIIDGAARQLDTAMLFIGNNRYTLAAGHIGERESLNAGILSLFVVEAQGWPAMALMAARVFAGHAGDAPDLAVLSDAHEVTLGGSGSHFVALDGEVLALPFPLTVRSLPRALRVAMPAPGAR